MTGRATAVILSLPGHTHIWSEDLVRIPPWSPTQAHKFSTTVDSFESCLDMAH